MGKKDTKQKDVTTKGNYTLGSKAAQHAYGELDDFLDQIKMKVEKVER
jgi:hypothetical protein